MHISFFPALGTRTRIPVESYIKQHADGVRAEFTAHLSGHDYAEAVKTGVRIEVWTNAPSSGRPAGEWGAITFEEVDGGAGDAQDAEEEPEPRLSLDAHDQFKLPSPVEVNINASQPHVFRAALVLPRAPGWFFAFTYRLIYPSGVCWLGSDRDNGVLELHACNAFFEENGFWETRKGRRVLVEERGSEQSADAEECTVVGKLDVSEWSWAGWATDASRVWSLSDNCLELAQKARLAYLIPTAPKGSLLLPQTHVFRATSENASVSITSQGHVVLRSCGQGAGIEYRVHDCDLNGDSELLRSEILSSCSAPQIFPTKNFDVILFTPDCDFDTCVTMYAQALTRTPTPLRSISVPISALDSFARHSNLLSFFIPETRSAIFVDRSEYSGDAALKFGASGAQVVVSAVYDLTDNSKPYPAWQFSLPLCTMQPEHIPASHVLENSLPTPPASPPPKPQRTVSFALPPETDTASGLRQRKPAEPSVPVPERSSAARRLLRSDSAFERFQSASGGEKVRVVIVNMLKMLARFMGVAVLRFLLFAFRFVGARQPEANSPDSGIGGAASPPSFEDGSELEEEADGEDVSSENTETAARSAAPIDSRAELSTEAVDSNPDLVDVYPSQRSIPRTSPALRWVLPAGEATPIRVLVRSDAPPDEVCKHLHIELDGEPADATGGVSDNASVVTIEIARAHEAPLALLIKLKD